MGMPVKTIAWKNVGLTRNSYTISLLTPFRGKL
jgi:hypothetical protein